MPAKAPDPNTRPFPRAVFLDALRISTKGGRVHKLERDSLFPRLRKIEKANARHTMGAIDAIRRTVGSYVLYPGDAENGEIFNKYHELLPGLGAFGVPPGKEDRLNELGTFITSALQTQRDKFSQLARINYWTHDTVKEEPAKYHAGGTSAAHGRPPVDTHIVLGYLRPDEDPEDYRQKGVFFCHAVEWNTSREPGNPTKLDFDPFRADLIGVFQKNTIAPWLGKVREVKMVTSAERAAELGRNETEMRAAYYFRFAFDDCSDEPPRDVASIVPPRPSKPVGCTLAQLGQCEPVI